MTEHLPPELEDLPGSAEIVYRILRDDVDGEATLQEMYRHTARPERTVRYGVERLLHNTDLVEERTNLQDARQSVYTLV